MTPGTRWILVAAAAAAGAVGALALSDVRRRHLRAARDVDNRQQIKSWENEGGNLAPALATPTRVVAASR